MLHKLNKPQHRSLVLKKTDFLLAVSQCGSALSAIAQLCGISLIGIIELILVSSFSPGSFPHPCCQFPHLIFGWAACGYTQESKACVLRERSHKVEFMTVIPGKQEGLKGSALALCTRVILRPETLITAVGQYTPVLGEVTGLTWVGFSVGWSPKSPSTSRRLGLSCLFVPGCSGRCWVLLQLLAWGPLSLKLSCLMFPKIEREKGLSTVTGVSRPSHGLFLA